MRTISILHVLPFLSMSSSFVVPSCLRLGRSSCLLFSSSTAARASETDQTLVVDDQAEEAVESPQQIPLDTSATDQFIQIENPDNMKYASPAEYENGKFQCDENVQFWRDLNRDGSMESSEMMQEVANVANSFRRKGGDAVNYWLRHNARTGYFLGNGVLGTVGSALHERLVKNSNDKEGGASESTPSGGFIQTLAQPAVVSRLLLDVAFTYEQDYQRIVDGRYKLPYDMYTINRQSSPLFFGQQTARFVKEAMGTISRRNRGSEEDKRTWISGFKSDLYPEYYQTAFHYQTDGWMSQESANVYETSTETLFLGRQDSMQRTALVPLVQYSMEKESTDNKPMKVLEIACGTGRFLTFARDNLPLDTEFTAVDLSPFYLDKARDNDKNWRSIRRKVENKQSYAGDGAAASAEIRPARMVQAKAEDLPFDDEEFDAVVCMYLYHEVPRNIRAQIASEMARVIKPGGRAILTDSIQLGDRPINDKTMGNFEKMNEPHYKDYIEDILPLHFEDAGLECLTKTMCSSTKTLAFGKPDI